MAGVGSRAMKRIRNRGNRMLVNSPMISLPPELVTEVLARVASSSATDLFTAKLSCKVFSQIAEESYVYKRVSLDKFPVVAWHHRRQIAAFFNKCKCSKNPEALYRQGVVDFFGGEELNSAIECLKEAMESGHEGASYAMAIILIFFGGDMKQKGITYLKGMKKSRNLEGRIGYCRESLRRIIRRIWVKNPLVLNERPKCCTMQHEKHKGWTRYQFDRDDNTCEACKCDEEIAYICDALPQIII
ncbi:putative F-box protein At1g67623 [Coffea arabica]|uniref:F-box protein At1g67623 n=1 Tax=Coffea arabica TaxID=13443 RepID=A0A6P6WK71_COFAR|nr:uncharacterized protein LOC113733430 [Coffea arabica]